MMELRDLVGLAILILTIWGCFQLARPYAAGESRVGKAVLVGLGILVVCGSLLLAILVPFGLCYLGRRRIA